MTYYKCGSIHPTQNSNVVVDTASGSIANFETPLAMPLLDTQIDVNAVQDLHGQSGAYPAGAGINRWDEEWELGAWSSVTGDAINYTDRIRCKNLIPVLPSTSYCIRFGTTASSVVNAYDENEDFIENLTTGTFGTGGRVITTPANCHFIKFSVGTAYGTTYNNDISVNYPATDTAYHPYSNICPIVGWDAIKVHNLGGNFFNKNTVTSGLLINGSGNEVSYADWNVSDFIPVIEGTSYYLYGLTVHPNTNQDNFELFDESKNKVGYVNVKTNEQPYIIPNGVVYIKCCVKNQDLDTAQFGVYVNKSFVPYNPVIEGSVIQLNNTYYGGRFIQDKSGKRKFEVTHEIIDLGSLNYFSSPNRDNTKFRKMGVLPAGKTGTPTPTGKMSNILCTIFNAQKGGLMYENNTEGITLSSTGLQIVVYDERYNSNDDNVQFKEAMTGVMCVYQLETPFTIDLPDDAPFKTFAGVNNIFANTGDTSLQFAKIGN